LEAPSEDGWHEQVFVLLWSTLGATTSSRVTSRHTARHVLTEPATDPHAADIAGVLCGAHRQVLTAAELSIERRIAGTTRADGRGFHVLPYLDAKRYETARRSRPTG
jgi:hypothetical protein